MVPGNEYQRKVPPSPDDADSEPGPERAVGLLNCRPEVPSPAGFLQATAEEDNNPRNRGYSRVREGVVS
jgi:hypothetical protein